AARARPAPTRQCPEQGTAKLRGARPYCNASSVDHLRGRWSTAAPSEPSSSVAHGIPLNAFRLPGCYLYSDFTTPQEAAAIGVCNGGPRASTSGSTAYVACVRLHPAAQSPRPLYVAKTKKS